MITVVNIQPTIACWNIRTPTGAIVFTLQASTPAFPIPAQRFSAQDMDKPPSPLPLWSSEIRHRSNNWGFQQTAAAWAEDYYKDEERPEVGF